MSVRVNEKCVFNPIGVGVVQIVGAVLRILVTAVLNVGVVRRTSARGVVLQIGRRGGGLVHWVLGHWAIHTIFTWLVERRRERCTRGPRRFRAIVLRGYIKCLEVAVGYVSGAKL